MSALYYVRLVESFLLRGQMAGEFESVRLRQVSALYHVRRRVGRKKKILVDVLYSMLVAFLPQFVREGGQDRAARSHSDPFRFLRS